MSLTFHLWSLPHSLKSNLILALFCASILFSLSSNPEEFHCPNLLLPCANCTVQGASWPSKPVQIFSPVSAMFGSDFFRHLHLRQAVFLNSYAFLREKKTANCICIYRSYMILYHYMLVLLVLHNFYIAAEHCWNRGADLCTFGQSRCALQGAVGA